MPPPHSVAGRPVFSGGPSSSAVPAVLGSLAVELSRAFCWGLSSLDAGGKLRLREEKEQGPPALYSLWMWCAWILEPLGVGKSSSLQLQALGDPGASPEPSTLCCQHPAQSLECGDVQERCDLQGE